MKQAFLIMAHKNIDQTKKLISFIADENHHVYVHIDKKNQSMFNELDKYFKESGYVYLIERRYRVHWGGISQVKVPLQLLEEATPKNYDFYHLISGQDLLIKSKEEIDNFLKNYDGKQFLEVLDANNHLWRINGYYLLTDTPYGRNRIISSINEYLAKVYRKRPIRPQLYQMTPYKGANWFTLSNDCAHYVVDYVKQHPSYLERYKYTICADEHFFQTLIMNSPFKETIINETLREIQWDGGANPKTYQMSDYELITESKALFARKFDEEVDKQVIEQVYQELLNENKKVDH